MVPDAAGESSSARSATVALATTAAVDVARDAGLAVDEEPDLLPGVSNVVLGFAHSGVVAKVATRPEALDALPRERALALELARLDAPAARPLEAPGPAVHDPSGFMVTLWHWVAHAPSIPAEPQACADALAVLHAALDATTTALPSFMVELGRARTALEDRQFMGELPPADQALLSEAFDAALDELGSFGYTARRLHGEPHAANRLVTPVGVVWVDLESACTGPREWDLAFLTEPQVRRTSGPIDHDLLACLRRLNHARLATWRWGVLRDHPELLALAQSDLAHLRGSRHRSTSTALEPGCSPPAGPHPRSR